MKGLFSENIFYRKLFTIITGVIIPVSLILSQNAYAFSEDICYGYKKNGAAGPQDTLIPVPFNCYDLTCVDGPAQSGGAPICAVKGMASYLNASLRHNLHGHNSLHFDVVWLEARALGMTPHDATLLATYSQSTDLGHYMPYDFRGKPLPVVSDNIYGVTRLNADQKGFWFHYPPWFRSQGMQATQKHLQYNFTHLPWQTPLPSWEAPLNHLRAWAFGQRSSVCKFGITNAAGNCYQATSNIATNTVLSFSMPILYPFPTASENIILDWQRIKYNPDAYNTATSTLGTYDRPVYAATNRGSIVSFGIYLHAMADRLSHFLCTDSSYIERVAPAVGSNVRYAINYATSCGQLIHMAMHYRETGHTPVPLRTTEAVKFSIYEIRDWIQSVGYISLQPAAVTGTTAMDALANEITPALAQQCAATRLAALCNVAKAHGLGWYDNNPTCSYPAADCSTIDQVPNLL
ncbi:MAG: hypothetical protein ACE5DY_09240 [Mariprofundaceae bacterium]